MLRKRIADEVILTGAPEAVQQLVDLAKTRISGTQKLKAVALSHKARGLQLGLIKGISTPETMGALAALARQYQLKVSVEPNCTTGNPYSQEINPWEWEVNPWEWEVNPWEWEVNPNNTRRVLPAGTTPAEGEALFWKQPALRQIGLTTTDGQRLPALSAYQGEGVLVGVFDTLPYNPVNRPWLTLHPSAEPLTSPVEAVERDLSDHGLISASLIHAVAPKAQVHLYEVCSKEGYGNMYPLLEALAAFIGMAAGRPAVINLSLGSMCAGPSSPALRALLQQATDLGIVVCAAAGNRGKSSKKVSTVPPAQAPAAFDGVIAVSACNLSDQRATYSQRGDIAAYGGEDLGLVGPGDDQDIIGMGVSTPAGLVSGYVIMDAGTSFSSPLVSGAAALVLGDRLSRGVALSAATCTEVLATLSSAARRPAAASESLSSTGLGAGILYLTSLWA